jgi:hypothetical protein
MLRFRRLIQPDTLYSLLCWLDRFYKIVKPNANMLINFTLDYVHDLTLYVHKLVQYSDALQGDCNDIIFKNTEQLRTLFMRWIAPVHNRVVVLELDRFKQFCKCLFRCGASDFPDIDFNIPKLRSYVSRISRCACVARFYIEERPLMLLEALEFDQTEECVSAHYSNGMGSKKSVHVFCSYDVFFDLLLLDNIVCLKCIKIS